MVRVAAFGPMMRHEINWEADLLKTGEMRLSEWKSPAIPDKPHQIIGEQQIEGRLWSTEEMTSIVGFCPHTHWTYRAILFESTT
jgi:hypothetical protein